MDDGRGNGRQLEEPGQLLGEVREEGAQMAKRETND
jgi:hypothetical protein